MHVPPRHADEVVDSECDEGEYEEEYDYDDCDDVVLLHVGRLGCVCCVVVVRWIDLHNGIVDVIGRGCLEYI